MNPNVTLKNWLSGNAPRAYYHKTIIEIGLFLILLLMISMYFHPNFSFESVAVSALGYYNKNQDGAIYFTIGFAVTGFLLLPHAFFLVKTTILKIQDHTILKRIFLIGCVLLIVAGPGMAFVGLFPEDIYPDPHLIAAIFAFGGLFFGALFLLAPFLKITYNSKEFWMLCCLYFQLILIAIINLVFAIIPAFIRKLNGTFSGMPSNWPIIEWSLFLSNLIWFIGVICVFAGTKLDE
jgi:hypothetical membrane protein